jgi:tRNA(Ile)-lysidine synthase
MLDKLKVISDTTFLSWQTKLLLATSGGLDSMVMAHLFHKLKYEVALVHCNFQLRAVETLGDQRFVQNYAEVLKLQFL